MIVPVTLNYSIQLECDSRPAQAFVLAMLPARAQQQQLALESLRVSGASAQSVFTDATTATRYLHVTAAGGKLQIELDVQLRLMQTSLDVASLFRDPAVSPLAAPESLRFLLPSRFCPSDRLTDFCAQQFSGLSQPYARLRAIDDWMRRHLNSRSPTVELAEQGVPGVLDVFDRGGGSPADLAHLMITLCRACGLPARFVTTVPLEDAVPVGLYPWVEVLIGNAWLAHDPSRRVPRTALLRIGTGRDAADVPLLMGEAAAMGESDYRVRMTIAGLDADARVLRERDGMAGEVCAAMLGSLAQAARWAEDANLAARQAPPGADPLRQKSWSRARSPDSPWPSPSSMTTPSDAIPWPGRVSAKYQSPLIDTTPLGAVAGDSGTPLSATAI
jgi:transglutaminase-like putative cysteine protease